LYKKWTTNEPESSGRSILPEPILSWVENVKGIGHPTIYGEHGTSIGLNFHAGCAGPKSGPFMGLEIPLKPIIHQQEGQARSFNKEMQCEQFYTKMTGQH
jgi:hypothetical protein